MESSTNGATQAPYATTIHEGDLITPFKWLLNEDDSTGDPSFTAANVANCLPARAAVSAATAAANPALTNYQTAGTGKLADCPWPSVHASSGHSTVIASGDNTDVKNIAKVGSPTGGVHKYLLSVTAPGYKIDGIHFEVHDAALYSVNEEVGKPFEVRMNPLPKKTATVRVHVYNDNASTNGQWDGQTETLVTCADATAAQRAANCPTGAGSTDPNLVGDPSTDMSGFSIQITDVLNPVTTDVYGNPLCTQYETDATGNVLLNGDGTPNPLVFNDPTIVNATPVNPAAVAALLNAIPHAGGATGSMVAGTQSTCISDHYGDIVIPNMGPNRYAATVIPPDPATHNGDKWVQTTTLEGGHDWDTWNIEGGTGYDTELIVGGERVTPVAHGFVKLTHPDQVWNDAEAAGVGSPAEKLYYNAAGGFTDSATATNTHGEIKGKLAIGRAYIGSGGASPLAGTNLANAKEDGFIKDGLVSISCLATCNAPTDTTIWTGRSRSADGTFDVTGLETGDYSVAFWDETQNYIMTILQYHVNGGTATPTDPNLQDVGHILLPGWNTDLQGSIFNDLNGNGVRDKCTPVAPAATCGPANWVKNAEGDYTEPGISDFKLTVRTRGNSLQDQGAAVAVTNDEGTFDLSQGYPLGQFLIVEAYNQRYKNTGFTYTTDNDGKTDPVTHKFTPNAHTVHSAQVDINFLPVIGLSAKLDWGVQAYGTGTDYWSGDTKVKASKYENGGIVGTATYDVTRNEFNAAYSVQEDYQPGVSGIPMQLWKTHKTNGVIDTYPGTGAVQQWGVLATAVNGSFDCLRPDTSRGTNAVTDASQPCKPFDYYVTESWQRPVGCQALDVNGNPLTGELAMPDPPAAGTVDYSHNPDVLTPASSQAQAADCIETPMNGFQIGGNGTVDGNFALSSLIRPGTLAAAPAGGSGLEQVYSDSQNNPANSDPLASADYVVEAVNPVDTVNAKATTDPTMGGYLAPIGGTTPKRLYRFTDETAVNIMSGDTYVPQEGYTTSNAAGGTGYSLVTPTSKVRADSNSLGAGTVAACAGGKQTLPDNGTGPTGLAKVNPDFQNAGGSPYAGQTVAVCDAKIVTVVGGRSMNPGFFMYTDVPVPSKFYGLVNDDLNVNVDRRSVLLGEVAPASNVPVGIYDENGNWKMTAHSDVNGFYEALVPSMDTYNCPLPAGPCPNMYRLVGNDPGTLQHKNLDYNPQFRTIATEFQAWTGVVHPVDQAPTHNGITIEGPAAQFGALSLCKLDTNNPVLFAIDKPYYDPAADATPSHPFVIKGTGFGANPGTLTLGATNVPIAAASWSDTQITFTVPTSLTPTPGPYQLKITNIASGLSTVNGLTFHVLAPAGATTYLTKADVYEVTPAGATDNVAGHVYTPQMDAWDTQTDTPAGFSGTSRPIAPATAGVAVSGGRAIQRAIEAASHDTTSSKRAKLVVVYPNTAPGYAAHNPNAAYFENVVLHSNVKIQGVGPGGATSSTNIVNGTNIDASQFWSATQVVPPGANQDTADGSYSDDWRTFASAIPRAGTGPAELPEGEAVLALAETAVTTSARLVSKVGSFTPGVDGVLITGGDQQGNPGNVNTLPGAVGNGNTAPTPVGPAQGGAIMTDQYVQDFNITNNQIQSNGGTYGTIRIGTPDLPDLTQTTTVDESSNHNDGLTVANNRIVANAGTNLAGALGIFAGAGNYTVSGNDFCGNFSAEYGGAISHYGLSPGGTISKNRIYYNQGYDEGGGIMIAGALPANNGVLSNGSGAVTIDANTLISNQSNDDGGGIRFLMAGNFADVVSNNIIANNLSTHEGGGIALDDAPNVTIVNNTIVKNITTGTAATNGAIAVTATNPNGIKPANPAGLSTGGNSVLLQASLPAGSPNWSKPKLLNNIFADNRAGWAILPTTVNFNQSAIHGVGDPGDTDLPQRWDVGVSTTAGLNNGTVNGVTQPFGFDGAANTTNAKTSATLTNAADGFSYIGTNNIAATLDGTVPSANGGVGFVNPQDFLIDSLMWRNNTNTSFPVIVAHMVPIDLLADYHLLSPSTTYALDAGAPSYVSSQPTATITAPNHDIDGDNRPGGAGFDRGADELTTKIDFAVTKAVSAPAVFVGAAIGYTITATNNGPNPGIATVTDTLPAGITGTWTCTTASPGATCPAGPIPAGNLSQNVFLPFNATATFVLAGTVPVGATPGVVANTATIAPAAGSGLTDTVPGNNTSAVNVTLQRNGNLKAVVSGPGLTVTRGQILPYVITVTNTGTTTMQETFSSSHVGTFTGLGTWRCAATGVGSTCNGALGFGDVSSRVITVAAGGTLTFTYDLNIVPFLNIPVGVGVPSGAAFGSTLNATATLTPNVPGYVDTNALDNTSTLTSTVVARLNLSLGNSFVAATRRFTVVVRNTGADTASGVPFSDLAPTGINFNWTCTSSGTPVATNCGGSASGSGAITTRNLVVPANGGTVTFTITATRTSGAVGPVTDSASASEPPNSSQANVTGSPAVATGTF